MRVKAAHQGGKFMTHARADIINWLHTKAEPGIPFHYTRICTDTGVSTSSVSKILHDLLRDSRIPISIGQAKGLWVFGPFEKLPRTELPVNPPRHTIYEAEQAAITATDVIGFTPQGNLVTRDNEGVIRIWVPAEYDR
jgi:hypothetical protein